MRTFADRNTTMAPDSVSIVDTFEFLHHSR
jgi:hypothetical protein